MPSLGAEPPVGRLNLTLSECVERALKNNLDVKIQRLSPRIAASRLREARAAYDPVFSLGMKNSYLDQPGTIDFDSEADNVPFELRKRTFSAGVEGKLPTGMSYQAVGEMEKLNSDGDFNGVTGGNIPPDGFLRKYQYGVASGIFLKQPLLKDLWIDAERLSIQVSKKNLKQSETGLLAQLMTTISEVQNAYYHALFAQEVLKLQRATLDSAQQLLGEVRSRIQAGALPPLEEKLFDYYAVNVGTTVVESERQLHDAQYDLGRFLVDDLKNLSAEGLALTDGFFEIEEAFDQMGSWRDAMTKRPDVQQLQTELEKQDIVLRFDKNQLYPSLDLVGSFGLSGVGNGWGVSTRQIKNGDHSFHSYGVVMSMPFSNRAARNRHRATLDEKEQNLLRYKKLEIDVLTEVEKAGKQMTSAYRRIAPSRKAAALAEEVLKSEQAKIQLGQPNGLAVVEARKRLTNAQIAAAEALLEYNKARAKLAFEEGETLERNKIDLDIK